jgi:hypothetical protein
VFGDEIVDDEGHRHEKLNPAKTNGADESSEVVLEENVETLKKD